MLKLNLICLLSLGLLIGIVTSGETNLAAAKTGATLLDQNALFSRADKLRDLRRGGGGFRGGGRSGGFRGSRTSRSSFGSSGRSRSSGGLFSSRTSRGSWRSRTSVGYYPYSSRIYYYNRSGRSYIVTRQSYTSSAILLATLGTIGIFTLFCGCFVLGLM